MQYETKYVFQALRAAALERYLDARLRPDPLHPTGTVHSVYYDSAGWRALEEKRASNYLKHKLRARWYADASSDTPRGRVFLELKHRVGSAREKQRVELGLSASEAAALPLESTRWVRLLDELPTEARSLAGAHFPAFELAYRRRRWVDLQSGARVCVDSEIRVVRSHAARGPTTQPAHFTQAVLECKYGSRSLPACLGEITRFGCRRGSFSKFGICAEQLVAPESLPSSRNWRLAR